MTTAKKRASAADKFERIASAIAQFEHLAGQVSFDFSENEDGVVTLNATYPAADDATTAVEDAAWTVHGGDKILEAAGLLVTDAGMDAYTDKYGDKMICEWATLSDAPKDHDGADLAEHAYEKAADFDGADLAEFESEKVAPVATSHALRNALTIERVVQIINDGTCEDGEFSSAQLAGQYAEQAAFESGYPVDTESIESHLDFLCDNDAEFDYIEAVECGMKINAARNAS